MPLMLYIHYLKIAWRNLLKYKMQSVISIMGLAVGMICFVVCSEGLVRLWASNRSLPHAEEVYELWSTYSRGHSIPCSYRSVVNDIRENFPEVEFSCFYQNLGHYMFCVVEYEGGQKTCSKELFIYADSSFLNFYDIELLQGNRENVKDLRKAVLLTPVGAKRIFGTKDGVVGKIFTEYDDYLGGRNKYGVAGIIPAFPWNTNFSHNAGIILNNNRESERGRENFSCHLRLREGVSMDAFNQKLVAYWEKHPFLKERFEELFVSPLLEPVMPEGLKVRWNMSLICAGIGMLVLLTALFNYMLFVTGRIGNRQKEYAIRQVAGASPSTLWCMFVIEITLLLLGAFFVSCILLELSIPLLTNDEYQWIGWESEEGVFCWLLTIMVRLLVIMWLMMAGICYGIMKRYSYYEMSANLGNSRCRYRLRLQTVLLICQLGICMLLVGGAYFSYAQSDNMSRKMLGNLSYEECKRIYEFNLNGDRLEQVRTEFENMAISNPNIIETCRCGTELLGPWSISAGNWNMQDVSEQMKNRLWFSVVDANYPEFIHAKMEEGRFFRADEPYCAVVNRKFANEYGSSPLGKEICISLGYGFNTYRIVGIIEDVIQVNENMSLYPCVYLLYGKQELNLNYYVKLAEQAIPETLEPLRAKLQAQVSEFTPVWVESLAYYIDYSVSTIREMGKMSMFLAGICIIISLLGVYSSMMLAVEKRSREMIIRKINGAMMTDIARIFVGYYLRLLVVAAVVAFPLLYYGVTIWLESYEYRIIITPLPFIVIFVMVLLIVLLTIAVQLFRIMKINPAERINRE